MRPSNLIHFKLARRERKKNFRFLFLPADRRFRFMINRRTLVFLWRREPTKKLIVPHQSSAKANIIIRGRVDIEIKSDDLPAFVHPIPSDPFVIGSGINRSSFRLLIALINREN